MDSSTPGCSSRPSKPEATTATPAPAPAALVAISGPRPARRGRPPAPLGGRTSGRSCASWNIDFFSHPDFSSPAALGNETEVGVLFHVLWGPFSCLRTSSSSYVRVQDVFSEYISVSWRSGYVFAVMSTPYMTREHTIGMGYEWLLGHACACAFIYDIVPER